MSKKVFVGLSGGVDSAVSAALLQAQGHEVTGVFIKIWQPEFTECTWKEDRLDAMRVTASLGIPFREIDLSDEYKKNVVDPMVSDYARGITPNPDVLCNRSIKFGAFAAWCVREGADFIATGHYARVKRGENRFDLLRAIDPAKDQSYFLHRLDQADLARALFPIGGLTKANVRKEALRRNLPVAQKPDSQGLCFVGHVSMHEFLSHYIKLIPGPVVSRGKIIGQHHGAALYTIGQRHGFANTSGDLAPHYVTKIDIATNTLFVSPHREEAARKYVYIENVHWVTEAPQVPSTVMVQSRYHEDPVSANTTQETERIRIEFAIPHIASPGQSLVMYEGERCLGGGIIM